MKKTISVIMSVFNGQKYLEESIKSVTSQSFVDFEFILVDDGSTDSSFDIIKKHADLDKRIKIIKNQKNIGLTKSLNEALKQSSGEFVARIDADDICYSDRLKKQIEFMEENKNCHLVSTCCDIINEGSEKLYVHCPPSNETSLKWSMIFRNPIRHSTVMWRNSEKFTYDEDYTYAQDYDLWRRVQDYGIQTIPDTLAAVRTHREAVTHINILEQDRAVIKIVKQQIEKYLGKEISNDDAKNMRYIYIHKHHLQTQEMELIEIEKFKKYISMYLDLVCQFSLKENIDELALEADVASDLLSLMAFYRQRNKWLETILIEMHKFLMHSKSDFLKITLAKVLNLKKEKLKFRIIFN